MKKRRKEHPFTDFVLDQLRGLGGVTARAMFGGHGLYKDGVFFAAIAEERLFFRVSDASRPRYEEAGMPPFAPGKSKPMRSYYEVPAEVLESPPQIAEWAREAIAAKKAAARPRKTS